MSAHHVVVVGAGFGGLETVRGLAGVPVRVTIVDRRNYHLFQPLLYQAATASLAPSEIAWPIRRLFRRRSEVTTLLAAVETIDKASRGLVLDDGSKLAYETRVGNWRSARLFLSLSIGVELCPPIWSGPLGADSDQAADLTVGRGLRSSNCRGLR
jgi:NADPH-dependent 2,4-dienoyl-CoA reductase/sulfur reductase-like enzyme